MMEYYAESVITIIYTIAIVTTNTLILLVVAWTESFRNMNKIYFCSLTLADLCVGVFITPFAVFSTFSNNWIYNDEKFCHFEAYLLAVFFIAGLYSMSWMSVDHYLAVRKPQRHKIAMTPTRSMCWIFFAWLGAISFCCPPLFSFERANFYQEVFICSIEAGPHKPYFVTAGVLVMFPAVVALIVTNAYIFTRPFQKKRYMFETILPETASRPGNYFMNFVVTIIFCIAWLPWLMLQLYGAFIDQYTSYPHHVHFYLLWIAIGNSCYKFFVYLGMSQEFRKGLRQLCGHTDCRCPECSIAQSISINFITVNSRK
ncbi:probable G-protein coupled receptor 21 [Mizuhopecten yessoensis]|uniref:probable G-protein coupled receptor 21 n=1 Tax=Mizuhopecten yessoensis TaxID=6573 RepID=UPI000B45D7DD|nr:probable G-protein coupled receptor 21 [Mizuhopecten yessoensis]